MAKGKYGAKAALRREDAEVQTELAAGRRHIVRLTEQVRELEGRLAEERRARKAETDRLRAMLDENLSPELIALRRTLEEQRDRARQAEAGARRTKTIQGRVFTRLAALLEQGFGLSRDEALEVIVLLANGPGDEGPSFISDEKVGSLSREDVIRIQAARGIRHHSDIVKMLHDLLARVTTGQESA